MTEATPMLTSITPKQTALSIGDINGFTWSFGDPGHTAPNHKVLRNDIYQSMDGVELKLSSKGIIWARNSINEWFYNNEMRWVPGPGPV